MSLLPSPREPSAREARLFTGLLLPGALALVGGLVSWRQGLAVLPCVLWGVALLVALAGLSSGSLAKLVHAVLLRLTYPIGWTISHLILLAVFYLVLTPIAVLVRLCGHDPLQRGIDRARASYWERFPRASSVRDYFRQS